MSIIEHKIIEVFDTIGAEILNLNTTETVLALVTGPTGAMMCKVGDEGQLVNHDGDVVATTSLYEVTAFCDAFQIRAVRNGMGANIEVITKSSAENPPETIDGQMLLWGKVDAVLDSGWCEISSARVGKLQVPAPQNVTAGDQLAFKTREILQQYKDGNIAVVATQLCGIVVVNDETQKGN